MFEDDEFNADQIAVIKEIFDRAEKIGLPLWLEGGWALDARLGEITREHADIDIAYPDDRAEEYTAILSDLGFVEREELEYGFIVSNDGIIVDSEPCEAIDGGYDFWDGPGEACPDEKEGVINGLPVRCITWEYMFWEYLYLGNEVPEDDWEDKHTNDLETIQQHVSPSKQQELQESFENK